jgi:hypothetical protein
MRGRLIAMACACACACGAAVAPGPARAAPATKPASIRLNVTGTVGRPALALRGVAIDVHGRVRPYAPGQTVIVRFYVDKRKLRAVRVAVKRVSAGVGGFHVRYVSGRTGLLSVHAVHYATARLGQGWAPGIYLRVAEPELAPGDSGPVVSALQWSLAQLHYAIDQSGVYDLSTEQALIAFCRVNGIPLASSVDADLFGMIARGEGQFVVRDPADKRHVEGDLTRQVLAEISPSGQVRRIYMISSGKPSTPTVVGHFSVYLKTIGTNAKGMVDASYFVGGYAIHGYEDVPTYPASHGCLRIPIPDALEVYRWATVGTPVDVYYESGGGDTTVSSDVGA